MTALVIPVPPARVGTPRRVTPACADNIADMIADHARLVNALCAYRDGKPESEWRGVLEYFTNTDGSLGAWMVHPIRCEGCQQWRLDLALVDGSSWKCPSCTRKK